jgi:hypothetical protein
MLDYDRRMIERKLRELRAKEAIEALPPIHASAAWLKPFCLSEWDRWPLTAPFTSNGHTWAACSQILLRMPVNPDVPVYEPGATHENEYLAERLQVRPQGGAGIERLWAMTFRQVSMRPCRLPVDDVHLTSDSVALLNTLPKLLVEDEQTPPHDYLSFRFEGGEGVVMRYRRPQFRPRPDHLDDEVPF